MLPINFLVVILCIIGAIVVPFLFNYSDQCISLAEQTSHCVIDPSLNWHRYCPCRDSNCGACSFIFENNLANATCLNAIDCCNQCTPVAEKEGIKYKIIAWSLIVGIVLVFILNLISVFYVATVCGIRPGYIRVA